MTLSMCFSATTVADPIPTSDPHPPHSSDSQSLVTIHPTVLISILTFYLFIFHVVYICHLENNSTENFNSLFIFVFFFQTPFFKSFPLNFRSLQSAEKYSGAIGWDLQGATSGMEDAKEQIVQESKNSTLLSLDEDRCKWFGELPWEESLRDAHEFGKLVLF
ncbi:hypothetical protein V6Z12_D11G288400 [Gossypium hirsutum]